MSHAKRVSSVVVVRETILSNDEKNVECVYEREREVTISRVIILENEKEAEKERVREREPDPGVEGGGAVHQKSFLLCLIESKTLDTRGQ